jgi:hypothetical protein
MHRPEVVPSVEFRLSSGQPALYSSGSSILDDLEILYSGSNRLQCIERLQVAALVPVALLQALSRVNGDVPERGQPIYVRRAHHLRLHPPH